MIKALLYAELLPDEELRELQNTRNFTKLMMRFEEMKTMPFGAVWDQYCRMQNVPEGDHWYVEVEKYEKEVLSKRKNG